MTVRGTLARAGLTTLIACTTLLLGACSSLPFMSSDKSDAAATQSAGAARAAPSAAAASAAEARADYRVEVQAPSALRQLLLAYLDLSRFQGAPEADAIDASELERLRRAAPAQARSLLETEGYFNAVVTADRIDEPGVAKPLIRIVVEPGPQARVASVAISASGALMTAAEAGDVAASAKLASLRQQWRLRVGDAFRQSDWTSAKSSALAGLRADGYASADWAFTHAQVDAPGNSAQLAAEVASGPLYRLGPLRIEGLKRYDEKAVRNLAEFAPGDAYSEKKLLDYQERLQKVGLFEGASVELDPEPQTAEAAPVRVRVREQPLQQATVGLGISANTGPRVSLAHTDRQVFGDDWIAKNNFAFGPKNQQWDGDLTSYPRDDLYRNFVGGSAQRLLTDDQTLNGYNLRVGRYKEEARVDRRYFVELTNARVITDTLSTQANAVSADYWWTLRDVDNLLSPTRGFALSTQTAVGYARGSRELPGQPQEDAKGPFSRLYARLSLYRPIGPWYGSARIEAAQVFTHSAIGVPDTLLFRAGGENSVRGYGYRTLGPTIGDTTVGGRALFTASLEAARPIFARYPEYLGAVFIDAGNAADRWSDLKPDLGYGVGVRWRSPVGPLSLDVAYGQAVKTFRLHLSVGVTF